MDAPLPKLKFRPTWLPLVALLGLLFPLYAWLPSLGSSVYASPDETAVAVSASEIATHGRAFLVEPLASAYPWLHPRSWVSVRQKIVPVGFLGWPAILSIFYRLFGAAFLSWLGALILLSSIYPLFKLLQPLGMRAAWAGTLAAGTFPPMILYANRGLFPNGVMLAGFLWSLWMIHELRVRRLGAAWFFTTGVVVAITIDIRPIELGWILPWWLWAGWKIRPTRRQVLMILLGGFMVLVPVLFLNLGAYGSWWRVGYWMRDNLSSNTNRVLYAENISSDRATTFLPFGFHPRNAWWNVRSFFGRLLWQWSAVFVLAVLVWIRERRRQFVRWSDESIIVACILWSGFFLLSLYGSGLYHDHVRLGAVTVANSFLRYVLLAAPLFGLSFAWLWSRLDKRPRGKVYAGTLLVLLVGFGIYRVGFGDDEGLWFTRQELQRYEHLRVQAGQWFGSTDVILSERSDKIFFPAFRAVSPLPSEPEVARLVRERDLHVGLFIRPLSQADKDAWNRVGLEAEELVSSGRERLYRLIDRSP